MTHKIYPDEYAASLIPHAGEKWRPSNGSDGDVFMSMNCHKCAFGEFIRQGMYFDDAEENERCEIVGKTFLCDVYDDEYPSEWQIGKDGQPTCTAFHPEGIPIPPERCKHTVDMFAPVIIGCDPAHHADITAIFVLRGNPPIPTKPCRFCGGLTNEIQFRGNAPEGCSEVWHEKCFKLVGSV
jgi:hypothetical protein